MNLIEQIKVNDVSIDGYQGTYYSENPEFLEITTDSEDNVLEGIREDGNKVIGRDLNVGGSASINGDIRVLGNMEVFGVSYKVIENPEYLAAWLDTDNKVIFGLRVDGKTYVGNADFLNDIEDIKVFLQNNIDKNIDWDALSIITLSGDAEFLSVEIDDGEKILSSRDKQGIKEERIGFKTPKMSVGNHQMSDFEDPETRTEITTDFEGKVISYRDKKGVKHEKAGIETERVSTKHLSISEDGMTEFQRALKESGFMGGQGDWTDATSLRIAEPYCAKVNFSGISDIPQSKNVNMHGYMEFWDMQGNFFKKEVIMNAQGASSMGHPKKNIAIDICNNNGWDDDDTFKLQIGNWVSQDGFHLKAYYMDIFKGLCPVAYKFFDKITRTRGELNDYFWKRALLDFDSITSTDNGASTSAETEAQFNNGARCFPDGFPCIVYLNGEFYGIYSWQLKKHRDNYHLNKKSVKQIHLDGTIDDQYLFDGNIAWNQFEVRNPKDLICMDGTKYDGDYPAELIDSTSEHYDSTNSKHVNTAKVKKYIEDMVSIKTAVTSAYATYQASEKTTQDKATFKEVFETYFDVMNLIDYTIFSDVSNNYDGFSRNWLWVTYDGVKWFIAVYDCDGVFGGFWDARDNILPPLTEHFIISNSYGVKGSVWPFLPLFDVYNDELEQRYSELRKDVIKTDSIVSIMVNWLDRIGNKDVFEKEWEKWPDFIKNDSIHRMYKWVVESINNMDLVYHYSQHLFLNV